VNIDELRNRIESEITSLKTFEDVKKVKASLLGRKGLFSEYLDGLKLLDRDEKKIFGKEINLLKMHAESRLKELESFYLEEEKRKKEALDKIDITMPGKIPLLGKKHPITQTL